MNKVATAPWQSAGHCFHLSFAYTYEHAMLQMTQPQDARFHTITWISNSNLKYVFQQSRKKKHTRKHIINIPADMPSLSFFYILFSFLWHFVFFLHILICFFSFFSFFRQGFTDLAKDTITSERTRVIIKGMTKSFWRHVLFVLVLGRSDCCGHDVPIHVLSRYSEG